MYYMSLHTIEGSKEKTFDDQGGVTIWRRYSTAAGIVEETEIRDAYPGEASGAPPPPGFEPPPGPTPMPPTSWPGVEIEELEEDEIEEVAGKDKMWADMTEANRVAARGLLRAGHLSAYNPADVRLAELRWAHVEVP